MRRLLKTLLLVLVCGLPSGLTPAPAAGQDLFKGAIGGAAGVAGGGYVTLSLVVAQARAGYYIQGLDDFLGWRSAPVLIGGGTGMAIGLWAPDRLMKGILGGALGTAGGLAAGLMVGPMIWDDTEARWAGGAIGAGVGLVVGSVIGVLIKPDDDKKGEGSSTAIPIAFRIRL